MIMLSKLTYVSAFADGPFSPKKSKSSPVLIKQVSEKSIVLSSVYPEYFSPAVVLIESLMRVFYFDAFAF